MADFLSSFYGGIYGDWGFISVAAAAIAVLASSILIMMSRLFGLKNLEQVAKTEFIYAISTVVIVTAVVFSIPLLEQLLANPTDSLSRCLFVESLGVSCLNPPPSVAGQTFMCGTQPCGTLIDWMKLYMETPTKCVTRFMKFLYGLAVPIDGAASIYMEIFMSEHASGFGVKWMSERIMNATQSLSFYMYAFYLLVHSFNFVKYYGGFFFSIGVALRAFPPTRGAGAYVMALSIGLYFVFPLSYILIASMATQHSQSVISGFDPSAAGSTNYICAIPDPADVSSMGCGAADVGRLMEYPDQLAANKKELTDLFTVEIDDFVRHLSSVICLFPMLAFVVLLTFVLNTTNLFGGNIPEIGRGLVKLI
ncbi:Uncharacterised protein [Candidatus Bilamarchaeum dharawalense]|uniref:Uncharacterized protein n=1 Tax=Candidatus Bilamarchaeum dharawalense TaxID=2885759 RepID=A0A5E4LPR6_9ARCH|nr:Uncharacterised protein [Candidatus Bilamarchaeum dharawalense]